MTVAAAGAGAEGAGASIDAIASFFALRVAVALSAACAFDRAVRGPLGFGTGMPKSVSIWTASAPLLPKR